MKLTDLLKKITPLPWKLSKDSSGEMQIHNDGLFPIAMIRRNAIKKAAQQSYDVKYLHHAANALPELVEAAQEAAEEIRGMRDYLKQQGGERQLEKGWADVLAPLDKALARATEVQP